MDGRVKAEVHIERCTRVDPRWVALRHELWPQSSRVAHGEELTELLAEQRPFAGFLAVSEGVATGFAEAAQRSDYVNGCDTRPVVFLEGIWVAPQYRRRGIARALIAAVEEWARELGCEELASDAAIDNSTSHAMHAAAGFEATERVVFFCKRVADQKP